MSRGNPGRYVALKDGTNRKGIVYNKSQVHGTKLTVHLIDEDFKPVISQYTNSQAILFVEASSLTLIGYCD